LKKSERKALQFMPHNNWEKTF